MADEDLRKLKTKKGQIKGKLSRARKYFNNLDKTNVDSKIIQELEIRLEKINPLWDEFNAIQGEIYLLENIDNEVESDEFENQYFDILSSMQALCLDFKKSTNSENVSVSSGGTNAQSGELQSLVKLPPIRLPSFNGHYDSWLEFKDCFLALVHNNNSLSDIQRFYYLKSSLEKDALQVIKSIEVSSNNYKIAWQMLQERYENKKLIIHNHLKAIFDYPPVIKESHSHLRGLFDNLTKHIRSLNSLGLNTGSWDCIIIYIMCSKLDSVTRREWENFKCSEELPTLQDLNVFLKEKCNMLEKLEVNDKTFYNKTKPRISSSRSFAAVGESNQLRCFMCQKDHPIYRCESFLSLNVSDRIMSAKRLKLCLNCLRNNHPTWKCKLQKCIKCHKLHNSLLHLESYLNASNVQSVLTTGVSDGGDWNRPTTATSNNQDGSQREQNEEDIRVAIQSTTVNNHVRQAPSDCDVANTVDFSEVLLSTALVRIVNGNKSIICRALLDSGSQSNFATERLCRELDLSFKKVNHVVKGVGKALAKIDTEVDTTIFSCYGTYNINIRCLVVPQITGKLPIHSFKKNMLPIPPNLNLADPNFNKTGDIDLLLGSSVFWSILVSGRTHIGPNMPVLQNTKFGWVIAGNLYLNNLMLDESVSCFSFTTDFKALDNNISKFWEIEELGVQNKILSKEEQICENHYKTTVKKDKSGKYIVKIPFKDTVNELGDSKTLALHRFDLLEKRLNKNPELMLEYTNFMSEYIDLNHMSEVDLNNDDGYFLPHHAIIKQSSLTTKCRVVFDGSAKSNSGLSLNDVQYVGPSLQQDIFLILVRFRFFRYVLSGDISKMYRQILIDNEDRKFQKVFWRKNPLEPIKCYELNTVTYGTASAPYLAVRTLLQVAEENEVNYPLVSEIIRRDFYMDDLLTASDSKFEIIKIQRDINVVLENSGFNLRKWLCNDTKIIKEFDVNRELDVALLEIGEQNKTLGIYWDARHDFIKYNVDLDFNIQSSQWNKRSVLSIISQIYDPLGLLGPIVVTAKLIMQDLWKQKMDWDQELPLEIKEKWLVFYNNMSNLNTLKITRFVKIPNFVSVELHGFSDASTKAYGCCIFVRCLTSSGEYVSNLLCAKSRVAPIKLLSLPRLELCGALLLAKLTRKVVDFLKIEFKQIYLWTDSTICLHWIKAEPSRWKLFVANRVQEIQNLTDSNSWHHVVSEENPADLLSRGVLVSNLIHNDLWWYGPKWFHIDNNKWNISKIEILQDIPETKNVSCVVITDVFVNSDNLVNVLLNRYSSFRKYLNVMSYILRFLNNCRANAGNRRVGLLQSTDIDGALTFTIRAVQRECFSEEYKSLTKNKSISNKSKILSLNPFIHDELIRVGGRLQNSDIPFNCKHQIILPNNHVLTKRILQHEHERLLHCGVQQLIYSIRQKFWPISARNTCKYVVNRCIPCFKAKPKNLTYLMGDLPLQRVNSFSVFENVGTDYGGPFFVRDRKTRGARLTKAYICLFVCMCTKAVHIELVSELTTDAFLAALKRFMSRRGKPSNIYSDNGSNYIGAHNQLNEIYTFLKDNSNFISRNLLVEKVNWHFIPVNSPNFGGLWEAGIKSIKSHLKRVMGNGSLTFEGFATLLAQVEGIMNSRPLCPMSDDPDDNTALTPAHFLIGRTLTMLPEHDLTDIPENRMDKWQRLQSLLQAIWNRWRKEYLNELQTRQKWKINVDRLLKLGSLVLVKDDKVPPLQWQLGRITDLHPGPDGTLRVATVKIRGCEVKRAVNRLCALPIEC